MTFNFSRKNLLMGVLLATLVINILINYVVLLASEQHTQSALQQSQRDQCTLMAQLHVMDTDIAHLDKTLSRQENTVSPALQSIHDQLTSIQNHLAKIDHLPDLQQIQTAMTHVNQNLIHLQRVATAHKTQVLPHYLSPAALPFTVENIDIWNDQPMATLSMDDDTELMGIGDSYGGWKLNSLDFNQGIALFENRKHQFVRVSV